MHGRRQTPPTPAQSPGAAMMTLLSQSSPMDKRLEDKPELRTFVASTEVFICALNSTTARPHQLLPHIAHGIKLTATTRPFSSSTTTRRGEGQH